MKLFKVLGVIAGAAVAVVAAPIVLPVAAAAGGIAAATAATAGGMAAAAAATATAAAATAGTALASTAIGSAVVAGATTVGSGVAAVGTAVASTAIGSSVVTGASTIGATAVAAGSAVAGATTVAVGTVTTTAAAIGTAVSSTSIGGAVVSAVTSVGTTIAGSSVISSVGVAGATVSGAIGASLTYSGLTVVEGITNNIEANALIVEAEGVFATQEKELKRAQRSCKNNLERFNYFKMDVYSNEISRGIGLISRIKQPTLSEIEILDIPPDMFFSALEIQETEKTVLTVREALSILASGTKVGIGTTLGTLSLVSQFGVASTGTAISSLSGIAASNATIACLGGGAVAAGGGGIALGSAVLGGLAIAPLSIVSSWKFAKNAQENLTEATRIYASICQEAEKGKALVAFINHGINPRIIEVEETLKKMVAFYNESILIDLEDVCNRKSNMDGTVNFKTCSKRDQETIKLAILTTKKIKDLIALKLFDDMGNIRSEVDEHIKFNN